MATGPLTDALRETLALFDEDGPPMTTNEVAERLDLGRRSTYDRLERLVERDDLRTKKAGANARVWWRTAVTPSMSAVDGDSEAGGEQLALLVDAVEDYAIFMLDVDGRVRTWNPGAERIKGYVGEEIVGEHFSSFYTEGDREDSVPEDNLEDAAANGVVTDEGWRVRADGSRFWAHVTITAIYDEDGRLTGYGKVTRDMTDRREREQAVRRERNLLDQVLETSPIGIGVFRPEGSVDRMNDRLAELLGLSAEEAASYELGDRELLDPTGGGRQFEESPAGRVLESGQPVSDVEVLIEETDGTARWLSVDAAPLVDESGDLEHVVATASDVTQRKKLARRLERQRDELLAEIEEMYERIDDAFYALDDGFRFTYVNDRAEELLGHEEDELLGRSVWEVFPEAKETPARESFQRSLSEQVTTSYEVDFEPLGIWVEAHVYPSETGLSVYFRDVTDRVNRERKLEEYERIVETVDDGIYMVDDDLRIQLVNDAYASITGYSREELLGAHISTVVDEEVVEFTKERREAMKAGQKGNLAQVDLETASGDSIVVEARYAPVLEEDGDLRGTVGVIRDVSERMERERELERYERIIETVDDGVYLVDSDGEFTLVNEAWAEMTGYEREELLGTSVRQLVDDETVERARAFERELIQGAREAARFEADVRTADGSTFRAEGVFSVIEADGGHERVGVVRDITERKQRERELEARVAQQETVTRLSRRALESRDLDAFMAEAAEAVAETLGNDYCKVLDLDADSEELLLRRGVGWHDGVAGSATVSATEADSQAAYTLASGEPVVVSDLETETRFSGPALLTDHDVRSGVSTVIGSPEDPWGILGTHDRAEKRFSEHDVNFVQSVANILAAAVGRHHHEEELFLQRERLAALDDLNAVVRSITAAVIDGSTRREIERAVCEGLAEVDSYEFAWVGDVDPDAQTMRLRTEAGVEGYLDDVTISIDPDDPQSEGPTSRAVRTGRMQAVGDVLTDVGYERWRDRAREYGFRSSAAIPILHDGIRYGVVNVYADRPNAFTDDEGEVIAHLGEIVGHAIAAVERKRALTSDEIVEIAFQVPDVFEAFDFSAAEGRLSFDRAVPLENGTFLEYGTATEDMVDLLEEGVELFPHWESVRFLGDPENPGPVRFEVRLDDPPVLSNVTALGGYVEEAVVEDGDYFMQIHLTPSADARSLIDAVQDTYPMAQMVSKQQITRESASAGPLGSLLAEHLTERQRSALEAAYFAGYFEWPRDVTGEEVADSLGVSAPTFHQHLRKAQKTLLEIALDDVAAA